MGSIKAILFGKGTSPGDTALLSTPAGGGNVSTGGQLQASLALVVSGSQSRILQGASQVVAGNSGNDVLPAGAYLNNGSTFDPERNNHEVTLLASAARTTTQTGSDQTNYNAKGAYVVIDVTAGAAAPGITPAIQAKDTLSGKYVQIHANLTKITAQGTYTYFFGLGTPAAAGGVTAVSGFPLPRVWRLVVTVDDTTSYTYSAAVNYCG